MDKKRANEIVESLGVIDVIYKDDEVWIENINGKNDMAQVKDLKTNKVFQVSILELNEV